MNDNRKRKQENDSNEQVLSYYVNNRIKLMQEVLSLIKPKKMMSMAPDFMKDMQITVVKSLLLEELLGISNKRLRSILAGENVDTDSSSSSESEIENKKIAEVDTLSLQEISDDSDCCIDIELSEKERLELEKDNANLVPTHRIKSESKRGEKKKDTGKQKKKKCPNKKAVKPTGEPVVNVLNLLELQARARAIRSQLANEIITEKGTSSPVSSSIIDEVKVEKESTEPISEDENSSDSVICIIPDNLSVISVESNSDFENSEKCEESKNAKSDENEATEIPKKNGTVTESVHSTAPDESIEQQEKDESDAEPWKTRWLESKKVQDVMKTTKLYNNLRQSRKQKSVSPKEGNLDSNTEETKDESTVQEQNKDDSNEKDENPVL